MHTQFPRTNEEIHYFLSELLSTDMSPRDVVKGILDMRAALRKMGELADTDAEIGYLQMFRDHCNALARAQVYPELAVVQYEIDGYGTQLLEVETLELHAARLRRDWFFKIAERLWTYLDNLKKGEETDAGTCTD